MWRAFVFLLIASACWAGDHSEGEQLVKLASDLVNIHADGSKPFQLDVDFQAQAMVPLTGHLTLQWAGNDLWSRRITLGDYWQWETKKGEMMYTKRNADFVPLRVVDLIDLLQVFPSNSQDLEAKKVSRKTLDGMEQECVEIRNRPGVHLWNPKRIACMNQANEVISLEQKDDQDDHRKEFGDYQSFHEHRYPRQLKLLINGSVSVKVDKVSLQDATLPESNFLPPTGAIVRRQCKNIVRPKPIKTPDPAYPRSAAINRLGGTVTVSATVLTDGSVSDVQLVGVAGHEMNEVSQDIIRNWKFKPAMCGDEPVAFDIHVAITFQLN